MSDDNDLHRYVEDLFEKPGREPLDGDIILDGGRADRIDQIIEDAYQDVIAWHNQRISAGADPQSGLHGLPYIPWDEKIDGIASMMGATGGDFGTSLQRNGVQWVRVDGQWVPARNVTPAQARRLVAGGISCTEIALIAVVGVICLIFMAVWL